MKAITHHVHGTLFQENGRSALLLKEINPQEETADSLYLRYALIIMGIENPVLPAFVLDDWGNEIKSLALYKWIREFGDQFPRAELFGFEMDGQETQHFLRELELYATWPCYLYTTPSLPLYKGTLIDAVLLPQAKLLRPQRIKRPSSEKISQPLRSARVSWWQVPAKITSFDFSLLGGEAPDAGF